MSEKPPFVLLKCYTLKNLFALIEWAHDHRRQWNAKTKDAGWSVEIEVIQPGEHESLIEIAEEVEL